MWTYPALITPDDNGTLLVTFPDVPEAITFGDDFESAKQHAVDALETGLSTYIDRNLELPKPSKQRSRKAALVTVSPLCSAKLHLYTAMREAGVRRAGLAKRLGRTVEYVDRLLDLNRSSKIEDVGAALLAMGRRFRIEVEAA